MKKNNGFTLIELLAVIVILAIIAVIATPLTINVINSSKEKSFIDSTYGLIDGARLLSAEQLFDEQTSEVVVNFTDGVADNENFKVSGDMPTSGTVYLNSEGKVELKVWSEELGKCAEKSATESEVKLAETTKENCKIEICPTITIMGKSIQTCDTMTNDPDHNLRYVGADPDNYVKFNGDELWRIIGVFDGQAKIIKDEYYSESILWNINADNSNNWATATLQLELNNDEDGYITTIETNDPTSYSYIDLAYVWDIGANNQNYQSSTRSDWYSVERSENPAGASDSEAIWTGAIGLMYPSDYGYSTSSTSTNCDLSMTLNGWDNYSECYSNSWLYDSSNRQWTITPHSVYTQHAFTVDTNARISCALVYSTNNYSAVRPVLFLKKNVIIVDGTGDSEDPFILGT